MRQPRLSGHVAGLECVSFGVIYAFDAGGWISPSGAHSLCCCHHLEHCIETVTPSSLICSGEQGVESVIGVTQSRHPEFFIVTKRAYSFAWE